MTTDRETEFTFASTDYVAVTSDNCSCQGCAFKELPCVSLGVPPCHAGNRKDKTSKIFVKK